MMQLVYFFCLPGAVYGKILELITGHSLQDFLFSLQFYSAGQIYLIS